MSLPPGKYSELRLIIHCYPKHTTAALVTRDRRGSENWDRRIHAWDLPLPQRDYDDYLPADQLWVILGALADRTDRMRYLDRPEAPEPPTGGYRGLQETLPCLGADLDKWSTLKSEPRVVESSGA